MHIHILGICGTFMGGIAVLAREAGHTVTGCDENVYPPMSTQLEAAGISLHQGMDAEQLSEFKADLYVVGNVMTRGMPVIEAILDRGLPYVSGPQWLGENLLAGKWVLAVAGTHGKTSTSAMLAWILDYAGVAPGFLIGGVPANFGISARAPQGDSPFFVIEADEYDTAFFDKRSKFVHYRPRTAVLNNLEYDHADIFANVEAIETQFHHLVRTVPSNGLLVVNGRDEHVKRALVRGAWTPIEEFGPGLQWDFRRGEQDSQFHVLLSGEDRGMVDWSQMGTHNTMNALAAIAAARHAGVPVKLALEALNTFTGVARRMQVRGEIGGVTVYDDFAHHPTAIQTTVTGLRKRVGNDARVIAVLEPRTNTMKLGAMSAALPASLANADVVFIYANNLGWDVAKVFEQDKENAGTKTGVFNDLDAMVKTIVEMSRPGDHVLVMSNGGFGGVHGKLLAKLAERQMRGAAS
ncbi:MAG: UDP-N-acetylmuramate:L-alanyl-gamma-D-glutamyl-meso-diaminopimelate ligase [Betaproteobacteria bacterium]|nr:UDP-N-acetylmuramate:L-alanyl-gamma-D-glutamyl-meso-diaminopimelate ligase [Betaproteobacteria bacterium]